MSQGVFFVLSTQAQQPIIDIDSVSDVELDTVEIIDFEPVLDWHLNPSTHIFPIIPQYRWTSEHDTDSQSDT